MPALLQRLAAALPGAALWRSVDLRRLRVYLVALWKLVQHPDTPRGARWLAWGVLAYTISPIDLIPDFIPVLGQLDELILVPIGIALAVRMVPPAMWAARMAEAEATSERVPKMVWGALIIVVIWLVALGALAGWWLHRSSAGTP